MQDADRKPGDVQAGASDPAFVSPYVLAAPPEVGVSVGTFCGRDSVRDVCGTASDSY